MRNKLTVLFACIICAGAVTDIRVSEDEDAPAKVEATPPLNVHIVFSNHLVSCIKPYKALKTIPLITNSSVHRRQCGRQCCYIQLQLHAVSWRRAVSLNSKPSFHHVNSKGYYFPV